MANRGNGSDFTLPADDSFASQEREAWFLLLHAGIPKRGLCRAYREISATFERFRSHPPALTLKQQATAFAAVSVHAKALIEAWEQIPPDLQFLSGISEPDSVLEFADAAANYAESLKSEQPEDLVDLFTDTDPSVDKEATITQYRTAEARLAKRRPRTKRGTQPAVQSRREFLLSLTVTWLRLHPAAKDKRKPVSWHGEQGKHDGPLLNFVEELLSLKREQADEGSMDWTREVIGKALLEVLDDARREHQAGYIPRPRKWTKREGANIRQKKSR